jgi:hypothetical protein
MLTFVAAACASPATPTPTIAPSAVPTPPAPASVTASEAQPSPAASAGPASSAGSLPAGPPLPIAVAGYTVRLFAAGTKDFSNPDSIVIAPGHVYVDYQNVTAKDGTDGKSSTILDYSPAGIAAPVGFSIVGHSDGLRIDPATGLLWATVNEDGHPKLYTIDPKSGVATTYSLKAPHGGGYDDLAFVGGHAYIAASNPSLNSAGINVFPAIDEVTLNGDHSTSLKPILMGNAKAMDLVAKVSVTLNEVDPDSMTVDPAGDLVLIDQGGSEIITVANPGSAQRVVSWVPVGTQLDDTVWASSAGGSLYVTDASLNATYVVGGSIAANIVYTESPNDSGVSSFLGTVDLTTGFVTPFGVGFGKPTGLLWSTGP